MSCIRPSGVLAAHVRCAGASSSWRQLRRGRSPRAYVLRQGVAHALAAGLPAAARDRLTDFAWLQARLGEVPDEATSLAQDASATLTRLPAEARQAFATWEAFVRARVHLLQKGDTDWPANRILLQLAVEAASDSPVTQAAEAWLAGGNCDWVWLRRAPAQRPRVAQRSGQVAMMWAHDGPVRGVTVLADGRFLSWSYGSELCLWSPRGALLATLTGHTARVNGVIELPTRELLSWSDDGTLRRWSAVGEPLAAHASPDKGRPVRGLLLVAEERWLSWGASWNAHLWEEEGTRVVALEGHVGELRGAIVLADERCVTWSVDGTIRVWTAEGEPDSCIVAHDAPVRGVIELPECELLSWSLGSVLRLWDTEGDCLAELEGHQGPVLGALTFPDGRMVTWAADGAIRVWDTDCELIVELVGHTSEVTSVTVIGPSDLMSTSDDGDVRVWRGIPETAPERGITRAELLAVQAQALRDLRTPQRSKRLRDYL